MFSVLEKSKSQTEDKKIGKDNRLIIDVSIIIPTYNRLWSLPKAIRSCYDTLLNIEVIVIDDGSTDDTWSWLSQQKNVIIIRQDNMG